MRGVALVAGLIFLSTTGACQPRGYRATFSKEAPPRPPDPELDFLKCHTRNGHVYVLKRWSVAGPSVTGEGVHYDAERKIVAEGPQSISTTDVALFETTRPESIPRNTPGYIVLGVVSAASLAITVACLTNPKACFGSCPTFYTRAGAGEDWQLQAEGFSASIARPFEETDVDAMWTASRATSGFELRMMNEAYETHLVDHVRVLSVLRPPGMRVVRAGNDYFAVPRATTPPTKCIGCNVEDLRSIDERAWLSAADPNDLAVKETIELEFPETKGAQLGLVIAARNSLLNTFVFYQGLAWLGHAMSDVYAALETSTTSPMVGQLRGLGSLLGAIDVDQLVDGHWERAGSFAETGPIAREVQLVPVRSGVIRVRLTMTKGNFKLDHVGLAPLTPMPAPTPSLPVQVLAGEEPDPDALERLKVGGDHLVTYPGDTYTLRFDLPPGDRELFVESRGFYYEWMRTDWYRDESPAKAVRLFYDPEGVMRILAPAYKRVEDQMEQAFWNSKVPR